MIDLDGGKRFELRELLTSLHATADRIEAILDLNGSCETEDGLDPSSSLNKTGLNLTPRGVEVCYRLYDQGKSRYAVARALNISFGAATHRFHAWEKLGGKNRPQQPLD